MDKPKVFKTQKFFGIFFLIALASLLPFKTCLAEVIGGSGGYYYSSEACEYEVLNQDTNGMLWGGTGYTDFYCCDADVSNKHESCPRWIVASADVFQIAWTRGLQHFGESAFSSATISAANDCINAGQDVLYTGEINALWVTGAQHSYNTSLINNLNEAHALNP